MQEFLAFFAETSPFRWKMVKIVAEDHFAARLGMMQAFGTYWSQKMVKTADFDENSDHGRRFSLLATLEQAYSEPFVIFEAL